MSNQAFLAADGQLDGVEPGSLVTVDGDEGHHAVTVKRVRPGEGLDLLGGRGRRAAVTVADVAKRSFTARVDRIVDEPGPGTRVVLVQALAKGDRDLQAVEAAVELGVSAVVPWQAERCVVRWGGEKTAKGRQKWESTVRSAVKQSRRAWIPEVGVPSTTAQLAATIGDPSVSGPLQSADPHGPSGSPRLVLVLHEAAAEPLTARVRAALQDLEAGSSLGEVWLLVGPEGGISEPEIETLRAAGALPAVLGRHVLRSGTAGPAALVLTRHLVGELD
ncbi:16S rRNA (uracil(1498)-N(3))-methyltransferase [Zhihengliuella sp.]|uniref:16S rRNA (uracil(1498)-N(3))-methyltransferase n=1 Tax=Zhihengliuella sp. TaxID=1954483 RepID=UPI002811282F|nr:16S rRNA (uracil(1498)-N(3))-methyltransferase [Zhihengliuella sp.]